MSDSEDRLGSGEEAENVEDQVLGFTVNFPFQIKFFSGCLRLNSLSLT